MIRSLFSWCFSVLLATSVAAPSFAKVGMPTDGKGRPLYEAGAIVVKLEAEAAHRAKSAAPGRFGTPSLDAVAEKLEVDGIEPMVLLKHSPRPDLPDLSRTLRVELDGAEDLFRAATLFAADPNVEYAEPIPAMYLDETPDDPNFNRQPFLPQILAEAAWDVHKGEDGAEVVVGISDSGVEWHHEDLVDNLKHNLGEDADGDGSVLENNGGEWVFDPDDENGIDDDGNGYVDDFIGWNFYNEAGRGDNDPDDPQSHGTHVSGLAAAVTDNAVGIASIGWNVKLLPTSASNVASAEAVVRGYNALLYLAENGADVINMSWGGSGRSQYLQEVMTYAAGLGSILVAAAGNDNTDEMHYPSAYTDVVSVASVGSTDRKASYSNYGISIDVSAPGGAGINGLYSTVPGSRYDQKSGTSMAAPVAAGLFALVKSQHPEWPNSRVIEQVLGTADGIDELNALYAGMLGSGRINALRALTEEPTNTNPTLRLGIHDLIVNDDGGDGSLQPGDVASFDFMLQNFSHTAGSDSVVLTLTSSDAAVAVIDSTVEVALDRDDLETIDSAFRVQVDDDAPSGVYTLTMTVDAVGADVVTDESFDIRLMVANGGVLVWEGSQDATYSGRWMAERLREAGLEVLSIAGDFPTGFTGFDGVFLSFGNAGEDGSVAARLDAQWKVDAIRSYLEDGGSLYLEGGDTLGYDILDNLSYGSDLLPLFGLAGGEDGTEEPNPIDSLDGQPGALTDGMRFTATDQDPVAWIDIFTVGDGTTAFVESDYGTVAVQNVGAYGQRTFNFSYAIADLVDGATTREELFETIRLFLRVLTPEEWTRPRRGEHRAEPAAGATKLEQKKAG